MRQKGEGRRQKNKIRKTIQKNGEKIQNKREIKTKENKNNNKNKGKKGIRREGWKVLNKRR